MGRPKAKSGGMKPYQRKEWKKTCQNVMRKHPYSFDVRRAKLSMKAKDLLDTNQGA